MHRTVLPRSFPTTPGPVVPLQTPPAVVMVRPHHFRINPQTWVDNEFMSMPSEPPAQVARAAFDEVSLMAQRLREAGVRVHLVEDTGPDTPDSVFPNNWFTSHPDGSIALYPMRAPARRGERRMDIIEELQREYHITRVTDYSPHEEYGRFLEGTGVMVLDHVHRIAYVCRSPRVDEELLAQFCAEHDYRPFVFDATDSAGIPIYHTNVMMAVGNTTAIVAVETIRDPLQRDDLLAALEASGRRIIQISERQMGEFAGNALEVWAHDHPQIGRAHV